jgi:hypothetical protein
MDEESAKFFHFSNNDPINLEEKKELFKITENIFKKQANVYASEAVRINEPGENFGKLDTTKINLCCDEATEAEIIEFGDLIKTIPKFSDLKLFEIYIALLFTYYSLRYNEPINFEWLYSKEFFPMFDGILNVKRIKDLLYDITMGDINININLSSKIRRAAMEMKGGKKKSKTSFKKAKRYNKKTQKKHKKHKISRKK